MEITFSNRNIVITQVQAQKDWLRRTGWGAELGSLQTDSETAVKFYTQQWEIPLMDAFLHLVFLAAVISTSGEWRAATSECDEFKVEIFKLIEGEAFYYVPYDAQEEPEDFLTEGFSWYKNGSQIENITTDEKHRVHFHGGALFFLNLTAADSGNYTAIKMDPSGECFKYFVNIKVYNASYRYAFPHGANDNSQQFKNVTCAELVVYTCEHFAGNFSWFKDGNLLHGQSRAFVLLPKATKDDEGSYTCTCTWTHNHRAYNSSGTRKLIVQEHYYHTEVEILSPVNKEQFGDEGSSIKLNCSVFCGHNLKSDCESSWTINGKDFRRIDGYNQTTKTVIEGSSKDTVSTAILTIENLSAEDFEHEFVCKGKNFYHLKNVTLILKRKESVIPLVIGGLGVLLIFVFAAMMIKCFAIDLALFVRPYMPLGDRDNDDRVYDAYVVYETQSVDKATEEKLSWFVTKILPKVLEDQCRYRLYIQGRDDIPGEDRLELVEECIRKSRRLMVILTPGSGSGSEFRDKHLASPQTSVLGGFDWQVGLHHALIQREMNVILIQLGDTGPQGYSHLPPGLQHLMRESAPIKWPESSRSGASKNLHFWKRVRYLMPVTPARKPAPSPHLPVEL
ncbi:interleukin-1 receptor-like 1 [Leuresthes tenuis]|uniref:interleukin-1 receptor-like 1 n=1 Tax=Leuresthes tenuis TaxID=355514 RepID=UPI003B505AFD